MEVALLVNDSQTKPKFVLTWRYRQGLWRYPSDPTAGDLGGMVPNLTSRTFGGNIQRVKSSHPASGPPNVTPFFLLLTRSAILCPLSQPHSIPSQIPPNRRDLSVELALVASFEVISPTSSHFLVKICAYLALFLPFANPRFVVFLSIYCANWITMGYMMFVFCMKYLC
jgi:hypothetical protein